MDIIGKTVASVAEQQMFGHNNFDDEVRWTTITITFTDGTSRTFAEDEGDVYNAATLDDECFYCDAALHLAGDVWVDVTGGDVCSGDDDNVNENEPHTPDPKDI